MKNIGNHSHSHTHRYQRPSLNITHHSYHTNDKKTIKLKQQQYNHQQYKKSHKERIADNYDSENDEHKQIEKMRAFKMELLVYGYISNRNSQQRHKRKSHRHNHKQRKKYKKYMSKKKMKTKTKKHSKKKKKLKPPPILTRNIINNNNSVLSGNMNRKAYDTHNIYLLPRDLVCICLMYYSSSFKFFSNNISIPSNNPTLLSSASSSSSSSLSGSSSTARSSSTSHQSHQSFSSSAKRRAFIKNKNKGTLKRSRRVRYAPNYKSPEQIFDAFIKQFKSVTPVTPPISDVIGGRILSNTLLSNQHRDYSPSSASTSASFSPSMSHSYSSHSRSGSSSSSTMNTPLLLNQKQEMNNMHRMLVLGVLMSSETAFTDVESPSYSMNNTGRGKSPVAINTATVVKQSTKRKDSGSAVENALYKISLNTNLKKSKFLQCAKAAMVMNNTEHYHKIHINGKKTESSDLSPIYTAFEINKQQFVASDIWSIGCIMGELLQMQSEIRSDASHRNYLFSMSCLTRPQSMDWVRNIEQMQVVFDVIGTPTNQEIKQILNKHINRYLKNLPTKKPNNLRKLFEGASNAALDVLSNCLKFDVNERITAEQVLQHSYFDELKDALVYNTLDDEKRVKYYSNLKRSLQTQIPNLDRIKIQHLRRLILKEISLIKK